jgi:hypothetical protein
VPAALPRQPRQLGPHLVDRLATDREVILLANRGVGASTGAVPDNVDDMARAMMITENSHLLAHHLPNSQLRIYADSGHGFLDQYPELFADRVRAFLNGG